MTLPPAMNVKGLFNEIAESSDYVGLSKELSEYAFGELTKILSLLIVSEELGNACDTQKFTSSETLYDKLVAQTVHPALLYIYREIDSELLVYGLAINDKKRIVMINEYIEPEELIKTQYKGQRIPFKFNNNEIIGYQKGMLLSSDNNLFKEVSEEEYNIIEDFYNNKLRPDLVLKN